MCGAVSVRIRFPRQKVASHTQKKMSQLQYENGSEEGSSMKPTRKRSAYEPPTHINCKNGHPLHPDKKKRTREVSEDVLKLASQIAIDVLPHTREYLTQPLCEVTYALVKDHALMCREEIASKFASIDAFIEWMHRIEPSPKKLHALQPAFKRYLSANPHNMRQLQTQRSFLDTRDTTPEHRSLVRLLSDGPERETAWYNATVLAGYLSEDAIRSDPPSTVFANFDKTHEALLKKTNSLTRCVIMRALIDTDIGTVHDAIGFGRPVDLLTTQQLGLHTDFKAVMRAQMTDTRKDHFATHYMHNVFLHLLVRNSDLQTEEDIATRGFAVKCMTSDATISAIVNAYRLHIGMEAITRSEVKLNANELMPYQEEMLAKIYDANPAAYEWALRSTTRHKMRCATRYRDSTIDSYGRVYVQVLHHWCATEKRSRPGNIGSTAFDVAGRIADYVWSWLQTSESNDASRRVHLVVASLGVVLGTAEFPCSGKVEIREVETLLAERHPEVKLALTDDEKMERARANDDEASDQSGRERNYFTDDEVRRMDAAVDAMQNASTRLMYILFRNTGMRATAVCRLKVSNVWNLLIGSPLDYGIALEKGGVVRRFPIASDPEVCSALVDFVKKSPLIMQTKGAYIFISSWMDVMKPMSKSTQQRNFKAIFEKAGVRGKQAHIHAFRSTVIHRLWEAGNSVDKIAKWIGHSHSKTTFEYYLNPTTPNLADNMLIPWLRRDNEVSLSTIQGLTDKSGVQDRLASSMTSSDDPLRQFLDTNYIPLLEQLQIMQAQLSIAKDYLKTRDDEESAQTCLLAMDRRASEIREKADAATMSLEEIMEEDGDEIDV